MKDDTLVRKYQFATKTADFVFCGRCGVMPVVLSTIDTKLYGLINLKASEDDLQAGGVKSMDFSDETKEQRLERRKRTWIGNVEIFSGS